MKHCVLLALATAALLVPACSAGNATERPNILFVFTDDMRADDLRVMPQTKQALASQGVTFGRAYYADPLCCPSRASIHTGRYVHNHPVKRNRGEDGGWEAFRSSGAEKNASAVWLQETGYHTAYMGKYFNGYKNTLYVPPGLDGWFGWLGRYKGSAETYKYNRNGHIATYERAEIHDTDVLANRTVRYIEERSESPWFLTVGTNAPHTPAYSAPRHEGMFLDEPLPTPPSFNEEDVSDKPAFVRAKRQHTSGGVTALKTRYQKRLRALQSVDDLVGRAVSTLERTGQLDETYIVFTSDNGYLHGEHRLAGKGLPYEESVRAPLLVRGPGIPAGMTRDELVSNIDLAPTFADWANTTAPRADGRSLSPVLTAEAPTGWRERLLIEHYGDHRFRQLETERYAYVEHETGEHELYDLDADPYQLTNLLHQPTPEAEAIAAELSTRLDTLRDCAGDSCRVAEDARP